MAAMSAVRTVPVSAVAAPATSLSSNAAFGSYGVVQQFAPVRSPASSYAFRIVVVRASHSSEEQSPVKSKVVAALVAAGAALALNVTPVSPATAGLFGGNVQVERGATAPDFPGNEGTGTKVGSNAGVRGSANSGTPLGEGAGGNLVGDNQSTNRASSTGTPFGEGSSTGSGVNVGAVLKVPDVANPLNKIDGLNPLKASLPDASSVVGDAKNAALNVADAKSKINGGLQDASRVVGDAKSAAQNVAGDAKTKVNGYLPDASRVPSNAIDAAQSVAGDAKSKINGISNPIESGKGVASNMASFDGAEAVKSAAGDVAMNATQGVATNAAQDLVENAKSRIGFPNPMEAGKALMSKVGGN